MRNDDNQHCRDIDEVDFCDLMFLMKTEVHVVKTGKMHATHGQQITASFILNRDPLSLDYLGDKGLAASTFHTGLI